MIYCHQINGVRLIVAYYLHICPMKKIKYRIKGFSFFYLLDAHSHFESTIYAEIEIVPPPPGEMRAVVLSINMAKIPHVATYMSKASKTYLFTVFVSYAPEPNSTPYATPVIENKQG